VKHRATLTTDTIETFQYPAFVPLVSDAFETLKCLPQGFLIQRCLFILNQGEHPPFIYLLRGGLVKLVYLNPDGRETMLGLRATGWYAGAASSLTHTVSTYSVKTITPCLFSKIAASDFSLRLAQSARLTRHFVNSLCKELSCQTAEAERKNDSAENRLEQLMAERNIEHGDIRTLDPLPMLKQKELAHLLSITPEHLSRVLHKIQTPPACRL